MPVWYRFNKYITMYVSFVVTTDISGYCTVQFDHLLKYSKWLFIHSTIFPWLLLKLWLIWKYQFEMNLLSLQTFSEIWGGWPNKWRCCYQNRKVPCSNPTKSSAGTQPHDKTPGELWVKTVKMQWLTSGKWGCPISNSPKLTVGQPNRS